MWPYRMTLIVLLCLLGQCLHAQSSLEEIDLRRIPQKRIREYIADQKAANIKKFAEVSCTIKKPENTNGLRNHERIYVLKQEINKVWDTYVAANPAKSWNGKRVTFGVLFSKISNNIMYNDGEFNGLDSGQVFYINVGIMRGLENLAVAFEILKVDTLNKKIEFSYVDGGKSQGIQTIQFVDLHDGSTQVVHHTQFKSDSRFRDRFLYPFFHSRVINEYHRNMKKLIS